MQHRVIEEQPRPVRRNLRGINIPDSERIVSAVTGAALAAVGLRQRGLLGGILAGLGAALVARGASGRSAAYRGLALREGVDVRRSVVVQRSRHEVFAALRDLRRIPRFMSHISSVEELGTTSHWIAQVGPVRLEWMSELVEEMPDLRLAWQSIPGGDLEHEGTIDLEDASDGRGTLVTIALRFEPPAGAFATPLRGLLRMITRNQLATDLIRLRQLLETGEVATGVRSPDQLHGIELREVAPSGSHTNGAGKLPPFQSTKA